MHNLSDKSFNRIAQAVGEKIDQHQIKFEQIDAVKIVYVDGEWVRDPERGDLEFALAGHHYRYEIIPEDEIWIEENIKDREDVAAIIIHEATERLAMKLLGIDYDTAHELIADPAEKAVRDLEAKNPKNE